MQPEDGRSADSTYDHCANFIASVRTRTKPVADVEIGHRASTVAHLGNIAFRSGQKIVWDAQHETILGAAEASKLLGREARKKWDIL